MTAAPIAEQVSVLRAGRPSKPPDEPMNPFEQEQAALALKGTPDGTIALGSKLANADLLDSHGNKTMLYDALGDNQAVVVFYRGAWCPYCNIALRTYQAELLPGLIDRGVTLVAISPQTPDGSLSTKEKDGLTFTVLSDPGNRLANQVGIITVPSPDALVTQLARGLDLTVANADGTSALPMPTTLILDANRVVRWTDVHPNYTTRSEPEEILAALDGSQ